MGNFLCKIWMFFLKVVDAVVDGVANVLVGIVGAIGTILSAIWDVVDELTESIFGKNTLLWVVAGLGLWFLLGAGDGDDEK